MSEMTPAQFKMATVIEHVVPKSPRFGGELRFAALEGGNAIRVDWNDTDLQPHSFEVRLHEIKNCKDMKTAIAMILDKMGPGHTVTHQRRKTTALTPDKAPAYTASVNVKDIFEKQVVACEQCETLAGVTDLPGGSCSRSNCDGKLVVYRVVQPKFPGQFKPFMEKIQDAHQLHSRVVTGAGPGGRPGPTEGRGEGVDEGA